MASAAHRASCCSVVMAGLPRCKELVLTLHKIECQLNEHKRRQHEQAAVRNIFFLKHV